MRRRPSSFDCANAGRGGRARRMFPSRADPRRRRTRTAAWPWTGTPNSSPPPSRPRLRRGASGLRPRVRWCRVVPREKRDRGEVRWPQGLFPWRGQPPRGTLHCRPAAGPARHSVGQRAKSLTRTVGPGCPPDGGSRGGGRERLWRYGWRRAAARRPSAAVGGAGRRAAGAGLRAAIRPFRSCGDGLPGVRVAAGGCRFPEPQSGRGAPGG